MTPHKAGQAQTRTGQRHPDGRQVAADAERRRRLIRWTVVGVVVAVIVGGLYAIFRAETDSTASNPGDYQVGSPGTGQQAPDFTLPSTTGADVALSDFRGENVLLYFHEGLGCQPCWDQIRDLERESAKVDAAGIDELVSITSAPTDLLAQKMRDDGLGSLALADPDLSVIQEYGANQYGMMGNTRAGHTFILVDADGEIVWRADYGGAPDYTMYLPVDRILADLEAARADA